MAAPAAGQSERYQKLEQRLERRQLIEAAEADAADPTRLGEDDAGDNHALESERMRQKMKEEAEDVTAVVQFLKQSRKSRADQVVVGEASALPSSSVLGASLVAEERQERKRKKKKPLVAAKAVQKKKQKPQEPKEPPQDALALLGGYS